MAEESSKVSPSVLVAIITVVGTLGTALIGKMTCGAPASPRPMASGEKAKGEGKALTEQTEARQGNWLFAVGKPFPNSFPQNGIGKRMSVIRATSVGKPTIGMGTMRFDIKAGPFTSVTFNAETSDADDPLVASALYALRKEAGGTSADQRAFDDVKTAALQAWGASGLKTRMLGTVLHWDDVGGYAVDISQTDGTLSVRKAKP